MINYVFSRTLYINNIMKRKTKLICRRYLMEKNTNSPLTIFEKSNYQQSIKGYKEIKITFRFTKKMKRRASSPLYLNVGLTPNWHRRRQSLNDVIEMKTHRKHNLVAEF